MKRRLWTLMWIVTALGLAGSSPAQVVDVTAAFDANRITVGQTTTLRIYGQVIPSRRAEADRIFSWYVDVLNLNQSVSTANYSTLVTVESDNDPELSSDGVNDGAHRRGIYDTFLEAPGAGVAEPIELIAFEVQGTAAGVAQFQVSPGTSAPALEHDFVVAPKGGGDFLSGGRYAMAIAELEVIEPAVLSLQIASLGNGELEIQFIPQAGFIYTVESRSSFGAGAEWTALPDAPHNSGTIVVPAVEANQFFRLRGELSPP